MQFTHGPALRHPLEDLWRRRRGGTQQARETSLHESLTWQRDGARAPASLHKGAVQPSGRFQIDFLFQDVASGVQFKPLGAPAKAWTLAECRNGQLFVADQKGTPFGRLDAGGKNYHGLDYPLFAMDIRENAEAREEAYVAAEGMAPAQK